MAVLEDHADLYVPAASGVPLCLRYWRAVTFVTYEDDGSTITTLTQHPVASDKTADTGSEADLAVITRVHKYPGVGGTMTLVTQTAANTYDLADDTTNDATRITVRADQLSDGYEFIEATVDGGICIARLHDPRYKLPLADVPSPLVAP
jgi:hypothetical protein